MDWRFWRRAAAPVFTMEDLEFEGRRQDIALKRRFAFFGLTMMTVQLVIANIVFWRYGTALKWRGIPAPVISAYLGTTVVQVVGVVLVMTKSLFPPRDSSDGG